MKKKHEEMEELLRSELDREAQEILAEIEADESLKDLKLPEENEEALLQKIQELEEKKAACEAMPEKDKEALRLGREMQALKENGKDATGADENKDSEGTSKTVPFKKRRRKLYLLVAIVAILTFAIGMTSIGEVPLVTEIKNQILGTSKMVKMNSAREGDESVKEEQHTEAEAYEDIESVFGVTVAQIRYLPEGVTFLSYEIDKALNRTCLFYQCQNSILEYRMSFNPVEQASAYEVEDKLLEEEEIQVEGILIRLKLYEVPDSKEVSYVAEFENGSVYYTLNTITDIEKAEIIKILENLKII